MPKTIDNPAQLKLDLFALHPLSAQSDNLPAVLHPRPQPARIPNLKLADKLDKLAATMQKTIDAKLHPAIGRQNITARRSRNAASMREEGKQLALIQRWLEGLAQSHRAGTCPTRFASIDNRKQLEDLATIHRWYLEDSKYLRECFTYGYAIVERLVQFGIKSSKEAIATVEQLNQLCHSSVPEIDRVAEKANELRRRAIYTKVPDFFPNSARNNRSDAMACQHAPTYRVLDRLLEGVISVLRCGNWESIASIASRRTTISGKL